MTFPPVNLRSCLSCLAVLFLLGAASAQAYEGYGAATVGGAGGATCHVTNLAASGAGSLYNCVTQRSGPTIVVFDVAGTIAPSDVLYITQPYITIDGTTAPSPGVTVRPSGLGGGSGFVIESTHDVIIRGLRLAGYNPTGTTDGDADLIALDGTEGPEVYNVVVDHVSLTAADDGAVDMTGNVHDVTVSWCFFHANVRSSLIKYDTRQRISMHHNVFAHNGERNPQVKGDMRTFDFRNNVVYDWKFTPDGYGLRLWSAPSGADSPGVPSVNVVGNAFISKNNVVDCGIELIEDSSPVKRWVSDNISLPSALCLSSNLTAPLAIPGAAQVSTLPSASLASILPAVGVVPHTATEQALLNEVAGKLPGASVTTLTLTKSGTGSGTVTSSPAGISCGSTCGASFSSGAAVTLSATAASGSSFAGWGGACTGTGTCQVTMSAARAVTATFTASTASYMLSVLKSGTGAGTVSSSPAGVSCGSTCSTAFSSGRVVTLSTAAANGSSFTGWSGACTGTGTCQVTMSAARSVTAIFTASATGTTYGLTVSKSGDGEGTISSTPAGISCGTTCSHTFAAGTAVTLSAPQASGSLFLGWGGACTGTGSCTVSMSAARSVTASFGLAMETLTVTRTGSGSVASSPAGISCGTDCTEPYNRGTVVSLSATAASGYSFGGWTGACTGTAGCSVTTDGVKTVGATFRTGTAAAVGDFNRDGWVDLLWGSRTTGAAYVWYLKSLTETSGAYLSPNGITTLAWQIVGLGDLNRDGQTDLLWRNSSTGALGAWLMTGTTRASNVTLPAVQLPSGAAADWAVRGLADFNGNGSVDILWRNVKTGDLYVTYLTGTTPAGGAYLTPQRASSLAWQVGAIADLNNDGRPDLVWNNLTTGELKVWVMSGTKASSYVTLTSLTNTSWRLVRAADFNNDGKPDLLFENQSTGELIVWYMNRTTKVSWSYLSPRKATTADWRIVPR